MPAITDLPPELWHHILAQLDSKQELNRVSLTCRYLNLASRSLPASTIPLYELRKVAFGSERSSSLTMTVEELDAEYNLHKHKFSESNPESFPWDRLEESKTRCLSFGPFPASGFPGSHCHQAQMAVLTSVFVTHSYCFKNFESLEIHSDRLKEGDNEMFEDWVRRRSFCNFRLDCYLFDFHRLPTLFKDIGCLKEVTLVSSPHLFHSVGELFEGLYPKNVTSLSTPRLQSLHIDGLAVGKTFVVKLFRFWISTPAIYRKSLEVTLKMSLYAASAIFPIIPAGFSKVDLEQSFFNTPAEVYIYEEAKDRLYFKVTMSGSHPAGIGNV